MIVSSPEPKVGIRRPSSTISNDISSEAVWQKLLIFGIKHPQEVGNQKCFLFRLDKNSGCHGNLLLFLQSHWRYLNFIKFSKKNLLLRNCLLYEADTLHTCSWH